jgi:hypothetical protein
MANTLTNLTVDLYNALDVVSRELVGLIPAVSTDMTFERAAKGQTVRSPVAPAASASDISPDVTPPDDGDQTIGNVTMSISKARRVPVRWNGEEKKSLDNNGAEFNVILRDQFAQAMRTLVNEVEADIAALYTKASRAYGTAGTTPFGSNLGDTAQMLKMLQDNGAPTGDLQLVLNTSAGASMRTLTQLTKANEAGSDDLLRRGVLLDAHGFAIRESAQVKTHSKGTATDVTVTGSQDVGDTTIGVTTAASTGSVDLSAGDYISIAGDDNKYIVTEDVTVAADSTGDIKIAEPGLMQATSGSEDVTTADSNFATNMAFARSALAVATRAPALPEQGDSAADRMIITDPMSGLSFDVGLYPQYRQIQYEIALAWGVAVIKPEHFGLLLG